MLFVSLSLPASADAEPTGWHWAWVDATQQSAQQGDGLPQDRATHPHCVLVLPAPTVSWQTVALPRTPAGKLRPVLEGLLEDHLLDDPGQLHFALAPDHKHGTATNRVWVAACHRAWLKKCLAQLATSGLVVTRLLPGALPLPQTQTWVTDDGSHLWVTRMGPDGVLNWPLPPAQGSEGSRTTMPPPLPDGDPVAPSVDEAPLFATPGAVARAEHMFANLRCDIQPHWRLWLELAQSGWDLAQFDIRLSTGARREQSIKAHLVDWMHGPQWKPLRWGLLVLAILQVAGLNVVAAQQRAALAQLQGQAQRTVTGTFPQITLVLDGPVQMQRELERLRQGRNAWSEQDLESVLERFGRVTDAHPVPLQGLDYSPQAVRFAHPPLDDAARAAIEAAFQPSGWSVGFTADGTELLRKGPM